MVIRRPKGHPVIGRGVTLVLLVLGAILPAWSASPQRYKVEVVGFESLDRRALLSEHWPEDPGAPSLAEALELEGTLPLSPHRGLCLEQSDNCQPVEQSGLKRRQAQQAGFQVLPSSQYDLTAVVKRLAASGRYRPLFHMAWRQPALTRRQSLAVRVAGGWTQRAALSSQPPAQHHIDGSLRLYRGRYLHVFADVVLYRFEAGDADLGQREPAAQGVQQARTAPAQPRPSRFRLNQHRRMRSGELHYLDHPMFGLLVQITPYLEPSESALPAHDAAQEELSAPLDEDLDEPRQADEN